MNKYIHTHEVLNDKVKLKSSGVEMDWRDSRALGVKKVKDI
jgi:hypothetical protein